MPNLTDLDVSCDTFQNQKCVTCGRDGLLYFFLRLDAKPIMKVFDFAIEQCMKGYKPFSMLHTVMFTEFNENDKRVDTTR